MNKFHINKHGVPAPCRAKSGNCPLGVSTEHFATKKEAQDYVDAQHKKEFGILPNQRNERQANKDNLRSTFKIAHSKKDKIYIENQKKKLKEESFDITYIERCRRSKRLNNYVPNNKATSHFEDDRKDKADGIRNNFGKGNLVGHYEVNHLVGKLANLKYKTQVVEIRDNGQMTIYDRNNGRTITTFMAHRARIEAMMLLAGEIPNNRFLGRIIDNRAKAEKLNLS